MATAAGPPPEPPRRSADNASDGDAANRVEPGRSLRLALRSAQTEDRVRGFLAIFFVLVLLALVFATPHGGDTTAAVNSAKTLSIAVVAFYFGLHKATPHVPSPAARDKEEK
jgi:hypothetical protein